MKHFFLALIVILGLSSCVSVKQIGTLNMMSQRNVDPNVANYQLLSSYSGGDKKELKKSKALLVEEAVNQTVKKIPGGEFLMNVKLYQVKGNRFAVEGDVWGVKTDVTYRGFKIGDKVMWKAGGDIKEGVVKSLIDDKTCYVVTKDGNIVEKKYTEISKSE